MTVLAVLALFVAYVLGVAVRRRRREGVIRNRGEWPIKPPRPWPRSTRSTGPE